MSDVEVFPIVFSQIHVLKTKMQKFFKVYLIYVISFGNLKRKNSVLCRKTNFAHSNMLFLLFQLLLLQIPFFAVMEVFPLNYMTLIRLVF